MSCEFGNVNVAQLCLNIPFARLQESLPCQKNRKCKSERHSLVISEKDFLAGDAG